MEVNSKKKLVNIFKECLEIIKKEELLKNRKALKNLSYLLILKLIEPHFKYGGEINIDHCSKYDFTEIKDSMVDIHKNFLLKMVRFSNLTEEAAKEFTEEKTLFKKIKNL
jgi:hypothetical protein